MQQSLFGSVLTPPEPAAAQSASLPETLLSEAVFTVLDIETTGLSPKKNSITEITAIRYQNGRELEKFSTLVKPTDLISAYVSTMTGITHEMVETAPPIGKVLNDLAGFLGERPWLVGHNVPFDLGFLQEKFRQNLLDALVSRVALANAFCTKLLAQKIMPGLPSYEGLVVATQCGVMNPNPHRAESDVRMTGEMFFVMLQKLRDQGRPLTTLQDLQAYQGALSPR